jgi:hypothetical protein
MSTGQGPRSYQATGFLKVALIVSLSLASIFIFTMKRNAAIDGTNSDPRPRLYELSQFEVYRNGEVGFKMKSSATSNDLVYQTSKASRHESKIGDGAQNSDNHASGYNQRHDSGADLDSSESSEKIVSRTLENGMLDLNIPIAEGPVNPNWKSLGDHATRPSWWKNAKIGMWLHWGPQSVGREGDWYAKWIYMPKHAWGKYKDVYRSHLERYGHPSKHGYKDMLPLWKAERWDPAELMRLYRRAGARYVLAQASIQLKNVDLCRTHQTIDFENPRDGWGRHPRNMGGESAWDSKF